MSALKGARCLVCPSHAAGQPCLWHSRLQDSLLQILRNKGGQLPHLAFPQHSPYPLARGQGTFCISIGRADCKCRCCLHLTRPSRAVGPGSKKAPTFCCPW